MIKLYSFCKKNFYAFHKNKRKKNFDPKELLKQSDTNENQKTQLTLFDQDYEMNEEEEKSLSFNNIANENKN